MDGGEVEGISGSNCYGFERGADTISRASRKKLVERLIKLFSKVDLKILEKLIVRSSHLP